jgi:hypothetical protein
MPQAGRLLRLAIMIIVDLWVSGRAVVVVVVVVAPSSLINSHPLI